MTVASSPAPAAGASCSMQLLPHNRALRMKDMIRPPDCRQMPLENVSSLAECAAACLAQPFCEVATWFGGGFDVPAMRRACIGRTAGSSALDPVPRRDGHTAVRNCRIPGCGLQERRDAMCRDHSAQTAGCEHNTRARNRRIIAGFGRNDISLEDYDWTCVGEIPPNATVKLACVDDRGAMAPCAALEDPSVSPISPFR